MREIPWLLLELKKLDSSGKYLLDFIKPSKFDLVICAVKIVCSYRFLSNNDPSQFEITSLVLKLGHNLRKYEAII